MRPSSPRSSRISSTTARYSRSSSRIRPSTVSSSGRSSTSTKRRPWLSVAAAPAMPRCRPDSATARPPPGSRMRSVTSATVPTFAYSSSCLGTSSTRSSSPTSTVRVTFMFGKTTRSSRGTSSRRCRRSVAHVSPFVRRDVVSPKSVATEVAAPSGRAQPRSAAKRPSAIAATRPASTSDETARRRLALHVITPATKTPPRQKTRPVSWRARRDPARLVQDGDARRARRRLRSSFGVSRTCARSQSRWRASAGVKPGCALRSGPSPPEASQIARQSGAMSQAVVYLPIPNAGCSSTRTGIRPESAHSSTS